jgi:Phytanoyl-CoA dioxygenase (PhyH)
MTSPDHALTPAELDQFLTRGFVHLRGCFTPQAAREHTQHIWTRLGYESDDPSTWARPSIHMASHTDIDVAAFAPRAWAAACQLVGGEDRLAGGNPFPWTDGFIVNLWQDADQPWQPPSADSPGWHVDGGFFRHYLDSPEQGLLAIVLWSDVVHQGGATVAVADSVAPVARFLADHPEGVLPGEFPYRRLMADCTDYIEATGEVGDVYLLHPFVIHAKSQNTLRRPRFITNSTLFLRDPMRLDRPDPADHSPVEQAILRALGTDRYPFRAAGPRTRVESDLGREHERTRLEERQRMAAAGG